MTPLDKNGIEITEGAEVYWLDPDWPQTSGNYLVEEVHPGCVALTYTNGHRPGYNLASFQEVEVQ